MTVTIDIPDRQAAALQAKATAEGLTLEGLTLESWISRRLADEKPRRRPAKSPQEAAARILELRKRVQPDPEGWTARDYINHGRS